MTFSDLGQFLVIDIETTGLSPSEDKIIDIGFLAFENFKLKERFSSLVQYEGKLSNYIQKLTGIDEKSLKNAPPLEELLEKLKTYSTFLFLAHNASFEESFLKGEDSQAFLDTIPLFSLIFPMRSILNLESLIVDFELADKEKHRGLEDSIDLFKVLLVSIYLLQNEPLNFKRLIDILERNSLTDHPYYKFLSLSKKSLILLGEEIDFDIDEQAKKYIEKVKIQQSYDSSFSKSPPKREFSSENIKNILRDEDKIIEKIPGYQFRESQEMLSLRVGQSFKNNVHSIIQAPTGTGKTIGYLIPSILFSMKEKRQVLVATGTKTLQHQLMIKDLPLVKNILELSPRELKVCRLIGSNNHYCELFFHKNELPNDNFENSIARSFFELILEYNANEEDTDKVITCDDLPYIMKIKFNQIAEWREKIAVNFRLCIGKKCPFISRCAYIRVLSKARSADIIISNQAMMFCWPQGLKRPNYIIIDEAHRIEKEASESFSYRVSSVNLNALAQNLSEMKELRSLFYLLSKDSPQEIDLLKEESFKACENLMVVLDELPLLFEKYFKERPRYTSIYWNELPMIKRGQIYDLSSKNIFAQIEQIRTILLDFYRVIYPYLARYNTKDMDEQKNVESYTHFESLVLHIGEILETLNLSLESVSGHTHSLKYHEEFGYIIESAPIDIGHKVFEKLLDVTESVVFTSATLGKEKIPGMLWPLGHTYLSPRKRFKNGFFLPPVFNYKDKAQVYLCDDTPGLYATNFVQKTLERIIPLIKKLGGRSMLLFSSKVRFEVAREILLASFKGDIPLFVQGMGTNVINEYQKVSKGILLGLESFSEGIDIPGKSLQFIFIDKIPDIRQDLIISDRRKFYDRTFGHEFTNYFLAQRARGLHQKLGRLLRTQSDFGGAIIVDSRVLKWKDNTYQTFTKLMDPYNLRRSTLDVACNQLEELLR